MNFTGTAGDDNINGTALDDVFRLKQGGSDTAFGDTGNDTFIMLGAFDASDALNGGDDFDEVVLEGDYSLAVLFGSTTMTNVEQLTLIGNFEYDLTLHKDTAENGAILTVDASAAPRVLLDASALRTGMVNVTGGASDDTITGGRGADLFDLKLGGADFVFGSDGKDKFKLGGANPHVLDGGSGRDTVILNGDHSGGNAIVMNATNMTGVEKLVLNGAFDYEITTHDDTVAASEVLKVVAIKVSPANTFFFDGSAETDGSFQIVGADGVNTLTGGAANDSLGGAGFADVIKGGEGFDSISGGAGADTFVYTGASESTSTSFDAFVAFNAAEDLFDLNTTINGYNGEINGTVNSASFDADIGAAVNASLGFLHAIVLHVTAGDMTGRTFLVTDINGDADYVAGSDYLFDISFALNLGNLGTGNFI
jgi:Ca2+-binding RTX toxin-like protein